MNEEIIVKIGADISGLAADLKRAQADISGLGDSVEGIEESGNKASFGIGKIVTAIGLVALAAGAFTLIKDSIGQAFGRIDTMEQFDRVMTTMTGSSEKANEVLDKTNDIVKGTAYGLDVGAKAVQDFVTSNMDVDKATDTVAAWGDAVAFYGDGSNESFTRVSDALAKMTTKGKVQMDTMNRLTEAGIPAMQIYADATGQSVEEVSEQMSNGALDAGEFTDVMNDALNNGTESFAGIEGAAKEAGASWGGSFANMRAAVARGTTAIIENIDEMLADNGLPSMRDMVADFGKGFENVMIAVADMIPPIVEKIKEIYAALEPWMPLIEGIALTIGIFVGIMALLEAALIVGTAAMTVYNAVLALNPWVLLIAAVIAAALIIYKYWGPISEFFVGLWESITAIFSASFAWIDEKTNGAFSAFVEVIVSYMTMAWDNIKAIWEWIKISFTNVLDFLKALVSGDFQGMKDAIKAQMENSRELISTIWGNIKNFFGTVLTQIKTVVSTKFNEVKTAISTKMNEAKTALVTKFSEMVSDAISKGAAIVTAVKDAFSKVYNGIKDKLVESVTEVATQIGKMPGKVRETVSDMVTAGGELIGGVIKGITGKIGEGLSAIGGFAKSLLARFKKDTATASPSRAFADISKWFAPGVVSGIDKTSHLAISSVSDLADDVTKAFNPELETPTMSYTTPNASFGSLSGAVNSAVDISASSTDGKLTQIVEELRKQRNMIVEMDGQKVGNLVTPHVNGTNAVDDVTRYF